MPIRAKNAANLGKLPEGIPQMYGKKDSSQLSNIANETEAILFVVSDDSDLMVGLGLQQMYPSKVIRIASIGKYEHPLATPIEEIVEECEEEEESEEPYDTATILEVIANPDGYMDRSNPHSELANAIIDRIDAAPYFILADGIYDEGHFALAKHAGSEYYTAELGDLKARGRTPAKALATLAYKLKCQ